MHMCVYVRDRIFECLSISLSWQEKQFVGFKLASHKGASKSEGNLPWSLVRYFFYLSFFCVCLVGLTKTHACVCWARGFGPA